MSIFLKSVGNKIRSVRIEQGLTLEEFADKTDLNLSYLAKIERGEKNVTLLTLERIINTLKIAPSSLFDISDLNNNTDNHHFNILQKHEKLLQTRKIEEIEAIHKIAIDIFSLIDIKEK